LQLHAFEVGVEAFFHVSVRSVAVGAIGFDGALELSALEQYFH
jgi:hypothetical protein